MPALVASLVAVFLAALAGPAAAGTQTRVLVVGDVGSGGETQRQVGGAVRAFERENPSDLLVTLGDNDYSDDPATFRKNWSQSFGWLAAAGVDVAGSLGDHDTEGPDDGRFEYEMLRMPGPYYRRQLGGVDVFVLDASSRARVDDDRQTAWLEGALKGSDAAWKIAVVHKPPYTCGRYTGSPEVAARWVPLFEQYGVQLVLSGDDHNYQRFEARNGVTYVVNGAGNERLYELSACPRAYPRRLAAASENLFLSITATAETLQVDAVAVTGERLDQFSLVAGPAYAEGGDEGWFDASFSGARRSPTGSKPESKLWWNDGAWWGSLFDARSGDFHIFRLDPARQRWVDTGVPIDERVASRADALWDGEHLYVASHVGSAIARRGFPSRLYRYSYDDGRYELDPGFPAAINGVSSEALVIDKDSTGRLWATWVQGGRVYVNRTIGGDRRWGEPFVLPVAGVEVGPDLSTLLAFGGDRIGVFWGNHRTNSFHFAVHRDRSPDRVWEPSEQIGDLGTADDHVNVKADSRGHVLAVVKTGAKGANDPLIAVLARDPETAAWSAHTVATVADGYTRPILLLDEDRRAAYVFMSGPLAPAREGVIVAKAASLDDLVFDVTAQAIPVIRDVRTPDLSDVTSTKQGVSDETGLVVLASNNTSDRYAHHFDSLRTPFLAGDPKGSAETAPVAQGAQAPAAVASTPLGFRGVSEKAAPALLVVLGLPVWLLLIAALRASRGLAVFASVSLVLVATAAAATIAAASLVL